MLDKFLGKDRIAELEERIATLEEDKKKLLISLDNQKEKEEKLKKKFSLAWSRKQEVEVELKQLKKKVESLEARLGERNEKQEQKVKQKQLKSRFFKFKDFRGLLEKLASVNSLKAVLISAYIPPANVEYTGNLKELLGEDFRIWEDIESPTGKVLLYDLEGVVKLVITPYRPLENPLWERKNSFILAPLKEFMETRPRMGVIIARAGQSFVGVTESPEKFEAMEEIKSRVARDHSRGGFSQRRFERLRDKDIHYHMEKLRETTGDLLLDTDIIVMSGDFRLTRELEVDFNQKKIMVPSDIPGNKKNRYKILELVWGTRVYYL